jgi:hypothetical protein
METAMVIETMLDYSLTWQSSIFIICNSKKGMPTNEYASAFSYISIQKIAPRCREGATVIK